jgi:Zn/Cd-binding protein ZinT
MLSTPQVNNGIKKARIQTQRSQANVKDNWVCIYRYLKNGRLDSVSATDGEVIRFTKKNDL